MPSDCDHRRYFAILNNSLKIYNLFRLITIADLFIFYLQWPFIIELQLREIEELSLLKNHRFTTLILILTFYFVINKFT